MIPNTATSQSSARPTTPEPKQEQAPSRACSSQPASHSAEAASAEPFGDVIYAYTRAAALEDGYLVDVTETAREAGFRYPVALTRVAWNDCVEWTDDDSERKHWPQDQAGRLWDVLTMTRFYMRGAIRRDPDTDRFMLQVLRVPREGRGVKARAARLMAQVGPGDNAEPVITIGFPNDF